MGATALTRYASPAAGYFASVNQAKKGIESMKHYKNLGKRVLSLFVVFIMCVSLVPGTALAKNVHTDSGDCELCAHAQKNSDHRGAIILGTPYWYCRCCGRINRFLDDDKPGYAGDERACTTYPNLHKKSTFTAKAPTCIEPGYTAGEACDYCNTILSGKEPIPVIDHQAAPDAQWQFDETNHWKVCVTCSEKVQVAAHTIERLTGKCTVCEYECKHVYAGWNTDADDHTAPQKGHHWQTCTICGYTTERVSHLTVDEKGVTADTSDPAVTVYYCVCGVEIQRDYHCQHVDTQKTYTNNGNGTHQVTCSCGEVVMSDENHTYVNGVCACGAESISWTPVCDHNGKLHYADNKASTHTATCSGCDFTATEEHTYGDWSAETGSCEEGYSKTRTCTLCGHTHTFNRPGVHERNYEVESIDGETHGEHCLHCGEPMKVAKHTFVNDVCKVCGAAKPTTPPVEPEVCKHPGTKKTWTDNEDGTHTVICSCGNYEETEEHTYDLDGNTKCKCGAERPATPPVEPEVCKHPGTKKTWTDNEDGTHTVTCSCGNYEKTEDHTYDLDGGTKCKCGATKSTTPVEPEVCKHHLNTVPERAPTCTEDGMKKHLKCSKCGKVFEAGAATAPNPVETTVEALTINKLSHDLTTTVVEATCTSKGSETTTCTRCGYSEKKELPMIAHTRKDVAAKAPTCLEAGNVEYWTCEVCNKNFTGTGTNSVEITDVTTPALGHDWVEDGKTDSTCSDKGNQHYTCSRCDAVKDEVIDPTGHTPETIAAKTPTCTETGLTEGSKCSVCDAIIEAQETVPALGHDIVTDEAVPATCTGTGLTEGSHCSRCDDAAVAQEVVAALGHDWDNGVVSTAATCDGAGVRTHTCQREGCGETETRAISALGHSAVSYANVAATCTTVGYTGGSYCSRCSAVITARTTVPATGHAWNAGVITTYPTYYSTGLRTYTCATCAATRTETIPQLTYTYDPGYTDPDPDPDPDYQPPVSSNRQPTTTIPDDNTPLGNTPNTPTVTIEDEDTPLANRPLPFIDVASGDWFRPYVSFVYGKGMMTGMSDTLFGPNVSTTRGMIVTIIYRMENASATGVSPFTDVERDEYYADPISWASDNGVVLGYSETLFGPKDNITREQMAAILYRYCVSKGIDVANYGDLSRFPDGDKVSDYAVEAMRWAVDRGLIAGMDDGRLDPTGTATRAQVATILNRFCEMIGA